jgi:hypothetical protein
MDNPKNDTRSKVVLNVTTYKKVDGTELSYPKPSSIDITDALADAGIDLSRDVPGIINGVTQSDPDNETIPHTHFVVPEQNLIYLKEDIKGIIEAAIVNSKQLNAVQKLVDSKFEDFIFKLWEQIRNGDIM